MSESSFDAFLSYSRADERVVLSIAQRLKDQQRLTVWLDQWNLVPGEPWQEAIEKALSQSRTCVVFLGQSGIGSWANEEMRVALSVRVRSEGFRVIPVLLRGATLPETGELPLLMSRLEWIDLRGDLSLEEQARWLAAGIRGQPPGRPPIETGRQVKRPYLGLEAFDSKDNEIFFGRESVTQHVLELLSESRFLAVIGPSGSGKSSLMKAGVIAKLKQSYQPNSENWIYLSFTPGSHPLNELARALSGQHRHQTFEDHNSLIERLQSDERALHLYTEWALADQPNGHFFILIDQFEELLTLGVDQAEADQFLVNLRYAITAYGARVIIAITMRADFIPRATTDRNLAEMMSGHQFLLGPMDKRDLVHAVVEPALLGGMEFESGLVELILHDAGGEPGMLPLLEDTLTQLYEASGVNGVATLKLYEELGCVTGALAARAEKVYQALSDGEQEIAKGIFLRLVQPGEGVEDTRSRAAVNELWPDALRQTQVETVVETLVNARLLTTSNRGGESTIEVVHEALIRGWPRLREWIDTYREALQTQHRLSESAREWRARNRDKDFLYHGLPLIEANACRDKYPDVLNDKEREFLAASLKAHRHQRFVRRAQLGVGFITLLAALIVVSVWALNLYSRSLATRALSKKRIEPTAATQMALQAIRLYGTREAESALRTVLAANQDAKIMRGHGGVVYTAFFDRSGMRIVTASEDGTAWIWDARSLKVITHLLGHTNAVYSASFSPDGSKVVTASRDKTARIWDANTGLPLGATMHHGGIVYWAAFSRDGTKIVSASGDTTACVWDANTGKQIVMLPDEVIDFSRLTTDEPKAVVGATFNYDGTQVITGTNDGQLHVWDWEREKEITKAPESVGTNLSINRVAINVVNLSPDGRRVVTGSNDYTVRIWELNDLTSPLVLSGHTGPVFGANFSPDGNYVVSASTDLTVRIWDSHTGKELSELRGDDNWVYSATFSPDGKQLLTASRDQTARLWPVADETKVFDIPGTGKITGASFSSNRTDVVTTEAGGVARVSNKDNSIVVRPSSFEVLTARFSSDDRFIVTDGDDKTARIWNVNDAQEKNPRIMNSANVSSLAFSRDNKYLIVGGDDYVPRIKEVATGRELGTLAGKRPDHEDGHTDVITAITFSADDNLVVTASRDQRVMIWDWPTRKWKMTLKGHTDAVLSVAFRPDDEQVVTGSFDRKAIIWDLNTGSPVAELVGHQAEVVSVAFSPNGKFVATSSADGTIRIWDAFNGAELWRRGRNGTVWAVAWVDNTHVLAVGEDRMVRSYYCDVCVPVDELIKLAKSRISS